jgi:hypothetical protein
MSYVVTVPWTRVNDDFIRTNRIDATPVAIDIQHPMIEHGPNHASRSQFDSNFYSKIALDIVNESVFHYPYPFISEKTLRPMLRRRMFIHYGPANMLRTLHLKGFVSFDNILDESYDSIEDPEERFLAVTEEIERFCRLDLETIKQYYRDNQDRFDHNFKNLAVLHQKELEQLRSTI